MHLFSWSHTCIRYSAGHTRGQLSVDLSEARQRNLESFYKETDVFVIDEAPAMAAASPALLEQTMTAVFSAKHNKTGSKMLPFGGSTASSWRICHLRRQNFRNFDKVASVSDPKVVNHCTRSIWNRTVSCSLL